MEIANLVLHYVSHTIRDNTLTVSLKDIGRDVVVDLIYRMDEETGVLARSARIENQTKLPFTIEEVFAATWNLEPGNDYQLRYLTGRWAGEWNLQQAALHPGKVVLESRRGSTGVEVNPWFAIERSSQPDQDVGDVWFGALGWSGSWQINVETDWQNRVRITGGYTPFDFSYVLAPGKSLETPEFYGGYSNAGVGGASRLLHRFELDSMVPQAPHRHLRPVLYNSWEATGFDVNEAGQEALAEKAASIGAERFVMDDGWFGKRKDDHAGLGDWYVNPQKFPRGLKPLIDKVHGLGMDFDALPRNVWIRIAARQERRNTVKFVQMNIPVMKSVMRVARNSTSLNRFVHYQNLVTFHIRQSLVHSTRPPDF